MWPGDPLNWLPPTASRARFGFKPPIGIFGVQIYFGSCKSISVGCKSRNLFLQGANLFLTRKNIFAAYRNRFAPKDGLRIGGARASVNSGSPAVSSNLTLVICLQQAVADSLKSKWSPSAVRHTIYCVCVATCGAGNQYPRSAFSCIRIWNLAGTSTIL